MLEWDIYILSYHAKLCGCDIVISDNKSLNLILTISYICLSFYDGNVPDKYVLSFNINFFDIDSL